MEAHECSHSSNAQIEAILDVTHREFSCNERSEQRAGSGSAVTRTERTELDRVRLQPILQAY